MSHSPVSLTIAARAVANLHGHTSAVIRLPVTDSGTRPLQVSVSVQDITKITRQYPGASWVRSVSPQHMTIKPGQTRWITLRIAVPAGQHGAHYTNFVARAAPVSTHGLGHLGAGVGGTLELSRPGHVTALAVPTPHAAAVPAPAPGSHVLGLLLVLLAALVLSTGAAALILRRRARRAHH